MFRTVQLVTTPAQGSKKANALVPDQCSSAMVIGMPLFRLRDSAKVASTNNVAAFHGLTPVTQLTELAGYGIGDQALLSLYAQVLVLNRFDDACIGVS